MTLGAHEMLYGAFAGTLALLLLPRAGNKLFVGMILFWLLSYPLLGRDDNVPALPLLFVEADLDLPPNRLLLLMLGVVLTIKVAAVWLNGKAPGKGSDPWRAVAWYELFMVLFLLAAVAALALNRDELSTKTTVLLLGRLATFPVVYSGAKWLSGQRDFAALRTAMLAMAMLSAAIGVVQFAIDPGFMNGAVANRPAFGDFARAPGLFFQEYDQGIFQVFGLVLAFAGGGAAFLDGGYLLLSSLGIFFTMHRLSWVALAGTFALLGAIWLRRRLHLIVPLMVVGIFLLSAGMLVPWEGIVPRSLVDDFVTERLANDTFTVRGDLANFGVNMLQRYPTGIGDYVSPVYNLEAYRAGIPSERRGGPPLVVHNGILSAGVRYGYVGMILFALFLITAVVHFGRRYLRGQKEALAPFLIALTFTLYNMSNDFSFLGTQIGVGFGLVFGLSVARANMLTQDESVVRTMTAAAEQLKTATAGTGQG